ncbi:MAG: hypothetical protein RLZZ628_1189 [Bacteroidota bacterium]|jgi:juvenile hormone diol kinase
MPSQFIQRKRALAFFFLDKSRDGYLKQSDFTSFAQGVAEGLGFEAGSDAYNKLTDTYSTIWNQFFKMLDLEGDDQLTLLEYINGYDKLIAIPNFEGILAGVARTIFDAIDTNGNGTISPDEYAAFLSPNGFTKEEANAVFQKLDTNGNGVISRDEFAQHQLEYWTSEDVNATGNWVFGSY